MSNPFRVGDLVMSKTKAPVWQGDRVYTVTMVEGDFLWFNGHHYKHDRTEFDNYFLVTVTSPDKIKR